MERLVISDTRMFLYWVRTIVECAWIFLCAIPALIFQLVFPRIQKDIDGKVALVTGAAGNLGREIAFELSRYGCTVICVDMNAEGNKRTAQNVVKLGGKVREYICDITDSKAVAELALKAGPVDILVNNDSIINFDSLLDASEATVTTLINMNITSHILMLRAFLPGMLERDSGHIVGIASCAGLIGLPYATLYSCSKFAVVGLMMTLAEELRLQGRNNIKTSCVCQYFIRDFKEVADRCDLRLPAIKAVDAARDTVRGIRQELLLFTVPRYIEFFLYLFSLLPRIIRDRIMDVFRAKIKPRSIQECESKEIYGKCS